MHLDFPVPVDEFVGRCSQFLAVTATHKDKTLTLDNLQQAFDAEIQYQADCVRKMLLAWQGDALLLGLELQSAMLTAHAHRSEIPEFDVPTVAGFVRNSMADGRGITDIPRFDIPKTLWRVDSIYEEYRWILAQQDSPLFDIE